MRDKIAFCVLFLLYNVSLFSQICQVSDLDLSGGYRNDTYKTVNTTRADSDTLQVDTIHVNNVSIWQVGVNGRIMNPGFQDSFLRNFFLTGFAYWGWSGGSGGLHEHVVSFTGAGELTGKAALKKATTYDFQLGLGYLFDWCEWGFGLSAGYAYDKQIVATKSGEISFPEGTPFVVAPLYGTGYQTVTKWRGPWLGVCLEYNQCAWRVDVEYDFHFANYFANHTIPDNFLARLQGVASNTHSSRAYGNVLSLNGEYRFYGGWKTGAAFVFQYWKANHGHLTSGDFALDGVPATTKVLSSAKWITYGFTLDVGYTF